MQLKASHTTRSHIWYMHDIQQLSYDGAYQRPQTFLFNQLSCYLWKLILSGAKRKALNTWERRTSGWKLFKNLNELLQETQKFAWRSGSWANFKISISERKYFWRKMSAPQLFKLKEGKYGSKQKCDAGGWFAVRESVTNMKNMKVWKYSDRTDEWWWFAVREHRKVWTI